MARYTRKSSVKVTDVEAVLDPDLDPEYSDLEPDLEPDLKGDEGSQPQKPVASTSMFPEGLLSPELAALLKEVDETPPARPSPSPSPKSEAPSAAVPKNADPSTAERQELERLRATLEEQRHTALEAKKKATELAKQLDSTRESLTAAQAELEKTSHQYSSNSKGGREAFGNQQAEIATLKANLYHREKTLAQQQHIRETEKKNALKKAEALEAELVRARALASQGKGFWHQREIRRGVLAIVGGVVVLAGVAAWVLWPSARASSGTASDGVATASVSVPGAAAPSGAAGAAGERAQNATRVEGSAPVVQRTGNTGAPPPPAAKGDFSGAVDELDYALRAFPGSKPEDVLRAVYKKTGSCALVWNEGHPSVLFGAGSLTGDGSLSAGISQCAHAVSTFR